LKLFADQQFSPESQSLLSQELLLSCEMLRAKRELMVFQDSLFSINFKQTIQNELFKCLADSRQKRNLTVVARQFLILPSFGITTTLPISAF
jgi:ABC-type microcin C transport system duplicated ATPase subunit YejF